MPIALIVLVLTPSRVTRAAGTCFATHSSLSDPTGRQSRKRAERDAHADPGRTGTARFSIPGGLSAWFRALACARTGSESARAGADAGGDWLAPGARCVPSARRAWLRLRTAHEFHRLDSFVRVFAFRGRYGHRRVHGRSVDRRTNGGAGGSTGDDRVRAGLLVCPGVGLATLGRRGTCGTEGAANA